MKASSFLTATVAAFAAGCADQNQQTGDNGTRDRSFETAGPYGASEQTLPPTSQQPGSRVYQTSQSGPAAQPQPALASDPNFGGSANSSSDDSSDSDRQLTQQIIRQLRADPSLAPATGRVRIAVSNGQVTLSGAVGSDQEKREIGAAVQRVTGVSGVKDELRVDTGPVAPQ